MNPTSAELDFGEDGFAEHYEAWIRPKLAELEAMRRKWLWMWMCLAAILLIGVMSVATLSTEVSWMFALFACFATFLAVLSRYKRKLKQMLMPIICDFFKDNKLQYHSFREGQIEQKVAQRLYSYTNLTIDDSFTGTHLGYDFLVDDVRITRVTHNGKNRHEETLFSGLVLGIVGNHLFVDEVAVCRNRRKPNDRKFQRILLEDVQFEKMYNTFGTNQIAARRLLEPRKMEQIIAAAGRIGSVGTAEFMFLEEGFFLFVSSSKDHFEFKSILTSVYKTDAIKEVLTDIRVALGLIETLQKEKILPHLKCDPHLF